MTLYYFGDMQTIWNINVLDLMISRHVSCEANIENRYALFTAFYIGNVQQYECQLSFHLNMFDPVMKL